MVYKQIIESEIKPIPVKLECFGPEELRGKLLELDKILSSHRILVPEKLPIVRIVSSTSSYTAIL